MNHLKLNFRSSKLLSQVLNDIYIISSKNEISYSTAPNGLIGISINIEGCCEIRRNNQWVKSPDCTVYGLIDSPDLIKTSPNFKEIAFGFKPFFFQLLTNEKMNDIVNQVCLDASLVFNKSSVEKLEEKIRRSNEEIEIIQAIEDFVSCNIIEKKYDKRIKTAMELIYEKNNLSVELISNTLNLSSTSLRTLFREKVGRSPKSMYDIIRINNILKSYTPKSSINIQDISFENGFFDLAHFNNSFKKKLGHSPKKYFKNENLTFDFYNFGRWIDDIFV